MTGNRHRVLLAVAGQHIVDVAGGSHARVRSPQDPAPGIGGPTTPRLSNPRLQTVGS